MRLLPIRDRAGIDFQQLSLAQFRRPNPNGTHCPVPMPVEFVFIISSHLYLIGNVAKFHPCRVPPLPIRERRRRPKRAAIEGVRLTPNFEADSTSKLVHIARLLPIANSS